MAEDFVSIKPSVKILPILIRSLYLLIPIAFVIYNILLGFQLMQELNVVMDTLDISGIHLLLTPVYNKMFLAMCVISFGMIVIYKRSYLVTIEYKFYKDRVEYTAGTFTKERKTISYNMITNVTEKKRFLEASFGLGRIYIDTAGSTDKRHELVTEALENSDEVYDNIVKQMNIKKA